MQHRTRHAQIMRRVTVFTDRYPHIGPIFWMLSIQYFVVQLIVAAAWHSPTYNWLTNLISDLGATVCGSYDGRQVCSPLYLLMDVSFVVFGITLMVGSMLIYTEFERTKLSLVSFFLMALSGIGAAMVGIFPENVAITFHMFGAFLGLVIGNLSILLLAFALNQVNRLFRGYTIVSAVLSLVAFGFFYSGRYLGIGAGGMERVVSYPFTVWVIVFGVYMSAVRFRAARVK